MMAAATELMLALAGVREGMRVLDIAAGMGDQSVLAAQRVGPTGSVLATDLSPVMLEGAQRKASELGLDNLECRVLDAQHISTLGIRAFDAAICRNGLMFPPDLGAVLRGIFGALKAGGNLGVVVWSEASRNPYQEIPRRVMEQLGLQLPQAAGQASRLGTPDILGAALRGARFVTVEIHRVPANRHFASVSEAVSRMREAGAVGDIVMNWSGLKPSMAAASGSPGTLWSNIQP